MNLTTALLKELFPNTPDYWFPVISHWLPASGIDTPREVASFLAQMAHESDEFRQLEENLNYSAKRLMEVWPRLFPSLNFAEKYARNPRLIANYVYDDANRPAGAKLGNVYPGDGYAFRGRGTPQLTGRNNYARYGVLAGIDLIKNPALLVQPDISIRVACAYWKDVGLDALDDDNDMRAETWRINGGEIGLQHRQALFDKYLKQLEESA